MVSEAKLEFAMIMLGGMLLRGIFSLVMERKNSAHSTGIVWFLWLLFMIPGCGILLILKGSSLLTPLFSALLAMAVLMLLWQLCRSFRTAESRKIWLCMAAYVVLTLCMTLFSRIGTGDDHAGIYTRLFADMLEQTGSVSAVILHYFLNVLLFLPLGALCSLAGGAGRRSCLPAIAAGALLSALIESIQLLFGIGICDVTDLLCNAAGTAAGALLGKLIYGYMDRSGRYAG